MVINYLHQYCLAYHTSRVQIFYQDVLETIEIFILKKSKSLSYIRGYIKLNYIPTIATKSLAASKKFTKFILPSITNGNSLIFSRKLVVVIVSEVLAI